MREIGKADKGARGDAQQLADDAVGPLGRLERLRQDRIIKGVAGIIDEVAVRIALHDGLTARDRRGGIGGVDLQSPRIDALVAQRRDQFAVAAADVQHARTSGHGVGDDRKRSEEHTSELQSLMRISYAVFCLNKKTQMKTRS